MKDHFFTLYGINENFLMAPLAPTVGYFTGFCLRKKKFRRSAVPFFFGGYPRKGGGYGKKILLPSAVHVKERLIVSQSVS